MNIQGDIRNTDGVLAIHETIIFAPSPYIVIVDFPRLWFGNVTQYQ